MLKIFLRHIFGIYALLIFVSSMIITFILYMIIFLIYPWPKSAFKAHQIVSVNWARFLFLMYGIRLVVHGADKLVAGKEYVFIGNHRSLLDIPAFAIATKSPFRFLAKEELTKIPLLGFVIRRLYISVDRKDKAARAKSMEKMKQSLAMGLSVFIFPEGTRNLSDLPLLPFKDGAFRLAIASEIPIAFVVLKESDRLLSPKNPLALSPGTLHCYWSEPIETKGLTIEDLEMLKMDCHEKMKRILES